MDLVARGPSLLNVGHQLSNLVIKTFLGLLLDLGKVSLEVGLLPFLLPLGVQGGLGERSKITEKNKTQKYEPHRYTTKTSICIEKPTKKATNRAPSHR